MIAAGKKFAKQNKPKHLPVEPLQDKRQIIGFFLHAASTLAHIDYLLSAIEGIKRLKPVSPLKFRLYVYNGYDESMAQRCSQLGVEVEWLSEHLSDLEKFNTTERLLLVRDKLAMDNVTALVWLSCTDMIQQCGWIYSFGSEYV
jgi:hypothetical protein